MWELNDPITWVEFYSAVRKLKNAKAPGLTVVPPEAFKAMSPANSQNVYDYVKSLFHGRCQLQAVAPQPMCSCSKNWRSI
jgi:hypothetical protein